MKRIVYISLFCFSLSLSFAHAQSCPEGSAAYQNGEYNLALQEFSFCLEKLPQDSSILFMNGITLLKLEQYEKAIPFLKKSIARDYQPIRNTQFAIGLSLAAIGDNDESLKYLKASVESGFAGFLQLDSSQFDHLQKDTVFISIKNEAYKNGFPCLKDENNNSFDFWLGEWEVFVNETKTAESSITKAKGGCAVHEDYVVLSGVYAGQSISYYDPTEKRWHQYWVGSAGDKSKYYETEGYESEANLQFLTKTQRPNGSESWTKMSYVQENENTVLQTLVFSTDEGKTWTPSFTGTYKRKTK